MEPFQISVQRFDEFAAEYAERFDNIDAYLPSVKIFCDLIVAHAPRILELACGPGNFTEYVKKRFPESEYIATDLAPKMIALAKRKVSGIDFRVMDMRKISLSDTKFDAILCSFGLPFLSKSDAMRLIADCGKLLNNEGVIYISTMEGDESKAGFEATSFSGESEVYFNYHQQKDIENALLENGYIIRDFTRQDYTEANGTILHDLIFVAIRKNCNQEITIH